MEWAIILSKIFEFCIIPLLGIITIYAVKFIQVKMNELKTNNSNKILNKYIDMLTDTVCKCVIATNQTYVESLKAQGKFDKEAQEEAFKRTYNAVIEILSDDAKEYLTNAYGDLTIYITQLIESEVNNNKGC